MSALATKLAVSVAGAVVVMAGLEALRCRQPKAAVLPLPPEEPTETPAEGAPRLAPSPTRTPRPEPRAKWESLGSLAMARIFGHVVGAPDPLDGLEVSIEDATRTFEPKLGERGDFEINLPAGNYTIHAKAGNLVAFAEVAGLTEAENREVTLTLVEGAAIEGRIEGCEGACRGANVHAATGPTHARLGATESNDHGNFVLDALVPGRAYDLTFETEGKRSLTLRGIVAPARNVVATLEPPAKLVGGFGLEPGQTCPMETVAIKAPGDGEREFAFDHACRFLIDDLPDAASVRLSASGEGWHFDVDVPLPAHGDPPFLCLHPTCREPEPTPESTLSVLVTGGAVRKVYVIASMPDDGERRLASCNEPSMPCVVSGLRPGPRVKVQVHAYGCAAQSITMDILAGSNHLTTACESVRMIQGTAPGAKGGIKVRCSAAHPAESFPRPYFRVRCPAHLPTIDYQLAADAPWRIATIEPTEDVSLGLARIMVD